MTPQPREPQAVAVIEHLRIHLPHGISLSCRACGPLDAPVLLFLHGFPEAAFVWDELLAHFGSRYRCIAPNLRGFADSSTPAEVEAYRVKHLLADLLALVDAVSPGRALEALVAHDWGGAVAWSFAVQHATAIQRLVIINSPHPATFLRELQTNPAQQAASAYMNFLRRPDAQALLIENDFARLWPFFNNMGAADPLRPGGGWLSDAVMKLQFAPEFVTVRLPTLVIWAEDDIALPVALIDGLGAFVPRMTLVTVPAATHWIVHEQPARVVAEIEAFLAS